MHLSPHYRRDAVESLETQKSAATLRQHEATEFVTIRNDLKIIVEAPGVESSSLPYLQTAVFRSFIRIIKQIPRRHLARFRPNLAVFSTKGVAGVAILLKNCGEWFSFLTKETPRTQETCLCCCWRGWIRSSIVVFQQNMTLRQRDWQGNPPRAVAAWWLTHGADLTNVKAGEYLSMSSLAVSKALRWVDQQLASDAKGDVYR